MWLLCPILFLLRVYVWYTRFTRNQSWDTHIEVAHRPYTMGLAVVDLGFTLLFGHFIWQHYKVAAMAGDATMSMRNAVKTSSCARLLIVNLVMVITAVVSCFSSTRAGAWILDITACFKFNFGTFFLVDLVFMREASRNRLPHRMPYSRMEPGAARKHMSRASHMPPGAESNNPLTLDTDADRTAKVLPEAELSMPVADEEFHSKAVRQLEENGEKD
ncbi:hypothetical protein DFJ77DRAFT_475306 [Powellomyces hirtus]|nr:hypothetical protein DFJ77DRAFT_475306 [Powellomyces hirtus]